MVHGLWSSPDTWTEMINDSAACPSAGPLPVLDVSVSDRPAVLDQRRASCAKIWTRSPDRGSAAPPPGDGPDGLVGHSMGGLLARLQTLESGDDFWHVLSDRPFEELKTDPETRETAGRRCSSARSVHSPRGHDRHAPSRQHFLQRLHPLARPQVDQAVRGADPLPDPSGRENPGSSATWRP